MKCPECNSEVENIIVQYGIDEYEVEAFCDKCGWCKIVRR